MLSGAKFELLKDSKVCYTGKSNSDGFVEWYKGEKKVSLSEMVKDTYIFEKHQHRQDTQRVKFSGQSR